MSIVRYDPWQAFEKFNQELNSALQSRAWSQTADNDDSKVVTSRWTPTVDIKEEPDRFLLIADVPGVDPKDIEITMEHSVLTIKGKRFNDAAEEHNGYKRVERVQGEFYRRFSLPESTDEAEISAQGEHGVLKISIPKKEKAQARRIEVAA